MFEFPSQKYFQNMYLDNLIGSNFSKKACCARLASLKKKNKGTLDVASSSSSASKVVNAIISKEAIGKVCASSVWCMYLFLISPVHSEHLCL